MATLRESLQSEIAALEAQVAQKKAQFDALTASAGTWLEKDVEEVKSFFSAVKTHLGL